MFCFCLEYSSSGSECCWGCSRLLGLSSSVIVCISYVTFSSLCGCSLNASPGGGEVWVFSGVCIGAPLRAFQRCLMGRFHVCPPLLKHCMPLLILRGPPPPPTSKIGVCVGLCHHSLRLRGSYMLNYSTNCIVSRK